VAAVGIQPHSGWAAYAIVERAGPAILDRGRVDLLTDAWWEQRQPYHAVLERGAPEATVDRVRAAALDAARAQLAEWAAGASVDAVAVIGRARDVGPLADVLRSHPLVHAAEGELYRAVWVEAAAALGLRCTAVDPKAPLAPVDVLAGFGRTVGRPWQLDHKRAASAALAAG